MMYPFAFFVCIIFFQSLFTSSSGRGGVKMHSDLDDKTAQRNLFGLQNRRNAFSACNYLTFFSP